MIAFIIGALEFRLTCTTYYADEKQERFYEIGRAYAHRFTFHYFDPC